MPAIGSSLLPSVATETLEDFSNDDLTMPLANNEYDYTFPVGTLNFQFQGRTDGLIKFKSSASGKYWTLFPGQPYFITNIKSSASAITIYFESTSAAQAVEVLYWS